MHGQLVDSLLVMVCGHQPVTHEGCVLFENLAWVVQDPLPILYCCSSPHDSDKVHPSQHCVTILYLVSLLIVALYS